MYLEQRGIIASPVSPNVAGSILRDRIYADVHDSIYGLSTDIFFKAVGIYDSYVARDATPVDDEQLITACIALASSNTSDVKDISSVVFTALGCNTDMVPETEYYEHLTIFSGASISPTAVDLLSVISIVGTPYLPSVVATALRSLLTSSDINVFEWDSNTLLACQKHIGGVMNTAIRLSGDATHPSGDVGHPSLALLVGRNIHHMANISYKTSVLPNTTPSSGCMKDELMKSDIREKLVDLAGVRSVGQLTLLGEGATAEVYKVAHEGGYYAVKVTTDSSSSWELFVNEISIMRTLDHPNVLKVKYLTTGFAPLLELGDGDLETWRRKRKFVTDEVQHTIAVQMFDALDYIHSMGCIHLDVKPRNIIVFEKPEGLRIALADFGNSRGCGVANTEVRDVTPGTDIYMPMEYYLSSGMEMFTPMFDIWAAGCTLYEVAIGKWLFNEFEDEMLGEQYELVGKPTEDEWPGVSDLPSYDTVGVTDDAVPYAFLDSELISDIYREIIMGCLTPNPAQRPTADAILQYIQ